MICNLRPKDETLLDAIVDGFEERMDEEERAQLVEFCERAFVEVMQE